MTQKRGYPLSVFDICLACLAVPGKVRDDAVAAPGSFNCHPERSEGSKFWLTAVLLWAVLPRFRFLLGDI